MIYVVETPHQGKPYCWSAFDRADLIARVSGSYAAQCAPHTIYEQTTLRDELQAHGYPSLAEALEEDDDIGGLAQMPVELDTPVYRAYYLGHEEYTTEVIDEFDAYIGWLERDLHSLSWFESDVEARAALDDELNWRGHNGDEARVALRAELERQTAN